MKMHSSCFQKDRCFGPLTVLAYFFLFPSTASASSFQILSAGPCKPNGQPGIPLLGEDYGLRVDYKLSGAISQPYRVKFQCANQTGFSGWIDLPANWGDAELFTMPLSLDGEMPWSITIDPDGVSGCPSIATNGTFVPVPPSVPVELYNTNVMRGVENVGITFQGGGSGTCLWTLFGVPTPHGAQTVLATQGPLDSTTVVSSPYGLPVYEIVKTNVPGGVFQDGHPFTVSLGCMRPNADLLRQVNWQDMDAIASNTNQYQWNQWLRPDQDAQSTDPAVLGFVQTSLPANYRSVLTPYDTARTLHRAVMKRLTTTSASVANDAVSVLKNGLAGCGGFADLLVAALRAAGIPARQIGGFWQGTSAFHFRVEFYLPGGDWIVADPSQANGSDPTGTYAYEFGYSRTANIFVAVDVGSIHDMSYNRFANLQVPLPFLIGGQFTSWTPSSTLALVATNRPPQLSACSVSTLAGVSTIEATYSDPDGDPPAYVNAQVVCSSNAVWRTYTMLPALSQTGNYASGVTYASKVDSSANLPPGTYVVSIQTTDGLSNPVTYSPGVQFVVQGTPLPRLALARAASHNVQMTISQVPSQGSLILQSSPDLRTWTPVRTNAATGATITLTWIERFWRDYHGESSRNRPVNTGESVL
jgi:hypothetical protein